MQIGSRSFDQFANLVMEDTVERIIVGNQYAEVSIRFWSMCNFCSKGGKTRNFHRMFVGNYWIRNHFAAVHQFK